MDRGICSFIFSSVKKRYSEFILFVVFNLSWALENTVIPKTFGEIIDGFVKVSQDKASVWPAVSDSIVSYMCAWSVMYFGCRCAGLIRSSLFPEFVADIRTNIFKYVELHSYQYFLKNFPGDISSKISSLTEKIVYLLDMILELIVPSILSVFVLFYLVAHTKLEVSLVLLFWVVVHMWACVYFGNRCSQYEEQHADKLNMLSGRIVDVITNYLSLKTFANENFECKSMEKYQMEEIRAYKKSLRFTEYLRIFLAFMTVIFGIGGVNAFAYYCWKNDLISLGELIFIVNSTVSTVSLSWMIGTQLPQVFANFGACNQAFRTLLEKHELKDVSAAQPLVVKNGEIEFRNVSFRYKDSDKLLFDNFSVKIKAGEKVGIVGYSGAGKTTFCNLIMRLYDINRGSIKIDGQDISRVSQESLRKSISMVTQDALLFHRSVRDNIAYGKTDATFDEIVKSARMANAEEFIDLLKDKYDTDVGECGNKLSRGQRQRIAIARASLKDAPILLLDEVTSALDPVSEELVQRALYATMLQKTVIAIAHRMPTLIKMDRILVFKDGNIVEEGSHAELIIKPKGLYRKMWDSQKNGFLMDLKD